jgi:type IV pilus assembly protein PilY1
MQTFGIGVGAASSLIDSYGFTEGNGQGLYWPGSQPSPAFDGMTGTYFSNLAVSRMIPPTGAYASFPLWGIVGLQNRYNLTNYGPDVQDHIGKHDYAQYGQVMVDVYGTDKPQSGTKQQARLADLLHAAYNSRGKYYAGTSVDLIAEGFTDALKTAISQSTKPLSDLASAGSSGAELTSSTVGYTAGYTYGEGSNSLGGWSGTLSATLGSDINGAPLWEATIPPESSRNIFTASVGGTAAQVGLRFTTAGLNGDASGITAATIATVRNNPLGDIVHSQLAYVGQPTGMSTDAGYATFAGNQNNRKAVVYVGANDGMLHGFDAGNGAPTGSGLSGSGNPGTGQELLAYVPRGLMPPGPGDLKDLSAFNSGYTHQYWVDGSPFSGDAKLATTHAWGTVLAGTLGAGGPGYFVLDVTDPTRVMSNLSKAVLIDATDISSTHSPLAGQKITNGSGTHRGNPVLEYIGSQFGQPVMDQYAIDQSAQVFQINSNVAGGEWAVIMGNGYNSTQGVPVLLIQSLTQTDMTGRPRLYSVAATCTSTSVACKNAGNGLGQPRPIDVDGNGTADIVYAGDLMGNLWKFDITSASQTLWNVANNGNPLFKAVGPTGAAQPITSAPVATANPTGKGGFMVGFGTGKNLGKTGTQDDANDLRLNSFYALYDSQAMTSSGGQVTLSTTLPPPFCTGGGGGPPRYTNCLIQQNGGGLATSQQNTDLLVGKTDLPPNETIDGVIKRGWYFDIPEIENGNAAKVLLNPLVLVGNTVAFYSQNVPGSAPGGTTAETCSTTTETDVNAMRTTVNMFNLGTGAQPTPDRVVTVDGQPYTFSGKNGNRFQIKRRTTYAQSGNTGMDAAGPEQGSIRLLMPDVPGKRAGWRIMGQ